MEADEDHGADSYYGTSIATDSTSLKSDILNYRFENGRRYHAYKAGSYLFPNDDQALDQMDIEHHLQGLMLEKKLHFSPLQNPTEILDLGTGTGIWAIDMADQHPNATVTGVDLSPTQPDWIPPNVRFEVDDYTEEWTFGANRFDLIHARLIMGTLPDIKKFLAEAYNALKPGGWYEENDVETKCFSDDETFPKDGAYARWSDTLDEAFKKINRPWFTGPELKDLFEAAGFVNVQVQLLKRPNNDWPKDPKMKEMGRWSNMGFMTGLEGFTVAAFTRIMGYSEAEVQALIVDVRKEFNTRSFHGYQKSWAVWGQKPKDGAQTGV